MIKLQRAPRPAIPAYVVTRRRAEFGKEMTRAEYERARAIEFFENPANFAGNVKKTKKEFPFSVYADKEVRGALASTFHNKCAYCEGESIAVAPEDIEHFRPKKEVDTGAGARRPGYYWLAAEWDNLLLSCQRCNRAEYHLVGDGGTEPVLLGKLIQFPLSDGRKRVRKPAAEGLGIDPEEPFRLLLDPCRDDPAQHLVFKQNGLVTPRKIGGSESEKGQASIKVFGLQRKGLVEKRAARARDVRIHLENLEDAAKAHHKATVRDDAEDIADAKRTLKRSFEVLEEDLDPTTPFLAVTRAAIRSWARRTPYTRQSGIDVLDMVRISERATGG